jgi:hypothetical protein
VKSAIVQNDPAAIANARVMIAPLERGIHFLIHPDPSLGSVSTRNMRDPIITATIKVENR